MFATATSTEGRRVTVTKGLAFSSLTANVCTVSEYSEDDPIGARITLRARTNGTCSISISFPGDGQYKPVNSTWSLAISGVNSPAPGSNTAQSIEFPALASRYVGKSQPLLAKATSGLQITYISITPDICMVLYPTVGVSVQSRPNLPNAESWTCTIRATQAGDDRYAPAISIDQSFIYSRVPMVLRVTNNALLKGSVSQPVFTQVRFSEDSQMTGISSLAHLLSVQSLTPSICRIDSNVLWDLSGGIVNRTMVTVLASGNCSLKFDFPGTKDRMPATLTWNAVATK